jgi:hypothetical protein
LRHGALHARDMVIKLDQSRPNELFIH